jgi:hypothetical protein
MPILVTPYPVATPGKSSVHFPFSATPAAPALPIHDGARAHDSDPDGRHREPAPAWEAEMPIGRRLVHALVHAILMLAVVPALVLVGAPGSMGAADAAVSIWPDPVTPGFTYDDPTPIEMGLKFRSDVPGYVTGVRFFKAAGATGTHIGRLWTTGGTRLAEVTFTNETPSGWQAAIFPTAVAIQANTTYIVSYYVGDGNKRFSDTFDFFATSGVDNPPLHALQNGLDGPNGVFSDDGGWFNKTYRSSNYWVDLIFDETAPPPDTTPPTVSGVLPAGGASGILVSASLSATFSEPMDAATIDVNTFELRDGLNNVVAASVAYDAGTYTATLDPTSSLAYNTTYTARVTGGSTGVKDLAENALATDYTWTFATESPDLTPPAVASVMPIQGAARLRPATRATARFSETMDAATINASTFELRDPSGNLLPASVAFDAGTGSATLTPSSPLARSMTCTARVKGGAGGVKDAYGNAMAADYSWTFGIVAQRPPVDQAPGGPILLIASPANLYTRYFTEILRTEGLNEFDLSDISAVTAGMLAIHDVVILGDMALTADQVTLLADWVDAGGHLVAMRPDKQLAGLLGLMDAATTLSNGYLLIDTSRKPGTGIVGQTLQFHGTADAYTLAGATSLATLYSDRTTPTSYPAVTLRPVGSNGGVACAFTFDLARSIVWTHQGNPAWQAGHVNPLQGYGTALDLFYPDWIDFNRITIPQADEQQRFLANLILYTNADRMPLPRFWYLPKGKKAAIILTGDDHWGISTPSGSSKTFFDRHKQLSTPGCSPDDWECIRSSSYGFDGCLLTDQEAAAYTAQGFELGLHADAGLASGQGWCGAWSSNMPEQYNGQLEPLMLKYASIPVQSSERSHCYSWFGYTGAPGWQGYAGTPEVEADLDIHLDTNISYNPAGWATTNPGYQMGSGMMMRFAQVDNAGVMTKFLDIYNAGTQMNDDNGQGAAAMRGIVDAFLDNAKGPPGFYGGFCVNMHSDNWYGWSYDGSDQIVASAQAHDIPVVSGRQMADWLDGRNSSSFGSIAWDGTTLAFTIAVGTGARNLMGMLPARSGAAPLSALDRGGSPVPFTREIIKGVEYAFFPATAGAYAATYAPDTSPPVISAVGADPTSGNAATISWTTHEPATSRVDYGISAGSLMPTATDPALVAQHVVHLTGLLPSTTYYYRVTSTDESGNTAVSPAAELAPATFVTPSAGLYDITVADFSAGSPDANLYISQISDGEVILNPAIGVEFSGSSLPAGWSVTSGTGPATVGNGVLTIDGAAVGPAATFGAGHSIEASATFTAAPYEHVGFGVNLTAGAGDAWAIISTGAGGTGLFARCWTGSGAFDTQSTPISGSYLGVPHRYRVDWNAGSIDYYVDGVHVATHNVAITTPMRPLLADGSTGVGSLSVDWLHMGPYGSPGVFTSRILDARGPATWQGLSWTSDLPAGAALTMSARTGDVPAPDGTWTAFTPIPTSGNPIGGISRYVQYQATLSSTDPGVTPVLRDVSILYGQDEVPPPAITSVTANPLSPQTAAIGWTTDVLATSRVDYGTSAGALTMNATDAALVTQHAVGLSGLQPSTTYYYRVTSADPFDHAASWPATDTAPATFTTPSLSVFDITVADFGAGTPDANLYVGQVADGEVILRPAAATEFPGSSLSPGWSVVSGTGPATVGSGVLTVNGSTVGPAGSYAPGQSVEAAATFTAGPHEHVGFGVNLTATAGDAWAIISTGAGGTGLLARCWTGSGAFDTQSTPIPGSYLGVPHRYRVDWNASSIDYYVDGVEVATHNVTITAPMRPLVSDGPQDAASLTVDWVHASPYADAGTFASRVFDAGMRASWGAMSWTCEIPSGVTMSARTGDTPAPDAGWSPFAPVGPSGAAVAATARYLQYRADLATGDSHVTPALRDVQILYTSAPQSAVAAAVAPGTCTSTVSGCVTVPVALTRTEAAQARAISVGFRLSPELRLCDAAHPANSIHPGSWLSAYESAFQVVDLGGGEYQVDQSILGSPCGITTGGQLFTLDLTGAGVDGVGSITVTEAIARDCNNAPIDCGPGAPASLVVDRTAPSAATGLAVTAGSAGGASGTLRMQVSFTVPGDAAAVEVYRAPFGSYPLYNRAPGVGHEPSSPASYPPPSPWTRVTGMTGPGSDDPGVRDFWYYLVATRDACGNTAYSTPSLGTLDYVLGDTHDGSVDCAGNNQVTLSDISFLGAHYGSAVPSNASFNCLDVGPTTDYRVTSRPMPDGALDFEDLAVTALDFGTVVTGPLAAHRVVPAVAASGGADALALSVPAPPGVGGTFDVALGFEGAGHVRALSVDLDYDPAVVEPVGVADGELLAAQSSPHVTLSARAGNVDVALLGAAEGIRGRGALAKMTFRVRAAGEPKIALGAVKARDALNREVALGGAVVVPVVPTTTQLSAAMPNPFRDATRFEYALARPGPVSLVLFGVDGRRIRTLVSGEREAGVYHAAWDGRDDDGRVVAAGTYFARLTARGKRITRTVVEIR